MIDIEILYLGVTKDRDENGRLARCVVRYLRLVVFTLCRVLSSVVNASSRWKRFSIVFATGRRRRLP